MDGRVVGMRHAGKMMEYARCEGSVKVRRRRCGFDKNNTVDWPPQLKSWFKGVLNGDSTSFTLRVLPKTIMRVKEAITRGTR